MADLVFRQGIDPSSPFGGIGFTKIKDNVVRAGSNIGNVILRDVVKISYNDTFQKAIYGVCTNEATGEITFDENIYPVALSTFTGTVYRYNDTDVEEVSVYRIGVDVENGLYSKAYNQYASNISYSLIIPAKRNEYFGVSSIIITSPDVAFLDLCDSKAYGVGLSEISLDTLNNKFKSSLEFNIATR